MLLLHPEASIPSADKLERALKGQPSMGLDGLCEALCMNYFFLGCDLITWPKAAAGKKGYFGPQLDGTVTQCREGRLTETCSSWSYCLPNQGTESDGAVFSSLSPLENYCIIISNILCNCGDEHMSTEASVGSPGAKTRGGWELPPSIVSARNSTRILCSLTSSSFLSTQAHAIHCRHSRGPLLVKSL